ncbi:MAG: hypothetical protein AB7S75_02230 [Desulfococcaceae bacterium]
MKKKDDESKNSQNIKRLSMDCKATVKIGNFSRGGKTRGYNEALDHDFGCTEKYIPCGILNENSGELHISFGSSHKTSDFIADTLITFWNNLDIEEKNSVVGLHILTKN